MQAGTPASETNTESSFGSSSSFNASNPFSDSSSSGFGDSGSDSATDSSITSIGNQHQTMPELKAFANNFEQLDGILNHFNATNMETNATTAAIANGNTKSKSFNPFSMGRTKSPAMNDLKGMEFSQSLPESSAFKKTGSHQVNYEALRETLDISPNNFPISIEQQNINDKAAMDFFKNAAAAAFSEFGGKKADPFLANKTGTFSNGNGNGYDGVSFNGKVILVE